MSSQHTQQSDPTLGEARLADIAPIFNLIQAGSLNGHFSNLYSQPRYMAGLGIQLFSMWTSKRIRLPDGRWHQARIKVLKVGGEFAGFVILRQETGSPHELEIYMCGVDEQFKGKGLGEWMLRAVLAEVPDGYSLFADCLPNSAQMKSLLRKLGFGETDSPTRASEAVERFVYR